MPNYYVGVMKRDHGADGSINLYSDKNVNLEGSHFLDCVTGEVHSDGQTI